MTARVALPRWFEIPTLVAVLTAILAAILAEGAGVRAQEISVEAIAAIVGDDAITFAELERRLNQRIELNFGDSLDRALIEQERPHLRREMLKFLIEESLLLQEARRLKIEVSDGEIDRELNRRIEVHRERGVNIPDLEALYQLALERDNMSREEVRDQVRRDMTRNKLLWEHVWPAPGLIPPGQIKSYYREHREEFQTPSNLKFRMLVVEPTEEAEFQLAAIDVALDEGRPFKEVEARFSESPGLWSRKIEELGAWPPSLREALGGMKAGEIRRRVRSSRGWHYLQMVDVEEGELLPFTEAQELIKKIIRERERRKQSETHLKELHKRYLIENMLKGDEDASQENPKEAAKNGEESGADEEPATGKTKIRRLTPTDATKKKKKGSTPKVEE